MSTTQTTGDRLFQAILERPGDDDLRLVFADWLEENGESEYGEFIRVQVRLARGHPQHHTAETGCPLRRREDELLYGVCGLGIEALPIIEGLTRTSFVGRGGYGWFQRGKPANGIEASFRRGFVSEVTLSLVAWVGRECPECVARAGFRERHPGIEPGVLAGGCDCHGKGRVDAHGPALVQAAPLEVVRVSDREPRQLGNTEQHFWYLGSIYPDQQQAHDIPEVTWSFLVGEENQHSPVSVHDTHDLANAALSRALLAWAHSAG